MYYMNGNLMGIYIKKAFFFEDCHWALSMFVTTSSPLFITRFGDVNMSKS